MSALEVSSTYYCFQLNIDWQGEYEEGFEVSLFQRLCERPQAEDRLLNKDAELVFLWLGLHEAVQGDLGKQQSHQGQ